MEQTACVEFDLCNYIADVDFQSYLDHICVIIRFSFGHLSVAVVTVF